MTKVYLFDWGDTLMVDDRKQAGKMKDWPTVSACENAQIVLAHLSRQHDIYIATAASSSTPEDIKAAFKRVSLTKYIAGYFCKTNTGYTKPDPRFYKVILQTLGIAPHLITMVGDNLKNDILPCVNLGMQGIWLQKIADQNGLNKNIRIITNLVELTE